MRPVVSRRKALIRGGLVGSAIGVPLGVIAGLFFARMVVGDELSGRGYFFVFMVTLAFVAWSGFLGAMLKLQADEPS